MKNGDKQAVGFYYLSQDKYGQVDHNIELGLTKREYAIIHAPKAPDDFMPILPPEPERPRNFHERFGKGSGYYLEKEVATALRDDHSWRHNIYPETVIKAVNKDLENWKGEWKQHTTNINNHINICIIQKQLQWAEMYADAIFNEKREKQ